MGFQFLLTTGLDNQLMHSTGNQGILIDNKTNFILIPMAGFFNSTN